MPGINGRELGKRALQIRPRLKILYMRGYSRNAVVHQAGSKRGWTGWKAHISGKACASSARDAGSEGIQLGRFGLCSLRVLLHHRWLLTSRFSFVSRLAVVPSSGPARANTPRARGRQGRPSCCPDVMFCCRQAARTAPRTARGSSRSGRRLLRADAREGVSLV